MNIKIVRIKFCVLCCQKLVGEFVVHVIGRSSSAETCVVGDASEEQLAYTEDEPEFSHGQLHYIIDMAVEQFWVSAESQATRAGIPQSVLDEVASSMKAALPGNEEDVNQPIFSKRQVEQLLVMVSEECGKALKRALDRI